MYNTLMLQRLPSVVMGTASRGVSIVVQVVVDVIFLDNKSLSVEE